MRKAILMSSAIIILATLAFAGTDVWKAKPYQQWDQKDISKILGDSPWSKMVQVEAPWTIGKSARLCSRHNFSVSTRYLSA